MYRMLKLSVSGKRTEKRKSTDIYIAGSMGGKKNTEELQIKDKLKGATRIKRGK